VKQIQVDEIKPRFAQASVEGMEGFGRSRSPVIQSLVVTKISSRETPEERMPSPTCCSFM